MNNILKPELVWIEGRCYRVNDPVMDVASFQEHDIYENDIPINELDDEDDDSDGCEILQMDGGRFCASIHVAKHYLGFIIGKKGATITRIVNDTKADIRVPRRGESKDVLIYGSNISSVKAAIRRIKIIVMSSRHKQSPTHFVSIPMNSPNIVSSFETFKKSVIQECSGIEESLFIKSCRLHVTVGVMCLMDNEERMAASHLLTEARDKYIMPLLQDYLPFNIRIKGLSYMNDDPKSIHVLYACVEEDGAPSGLIQRLCDMIYANFCKAGCMKKEHNRDNVKMHVTLLNSKYRTQEDDLDDSRSENLQKRRESFDGTEILAKFANYDFGVIELNNIHLSQCGTEGPDGYYQSTCVISCNRQ